MGLHGLTRITLTLEFDDGTRKEFALVGEHLGHKGSSVSRGNVERALAEVLLADGLVDFVGEEIIRGGERALSAVPEVVDPFIDLMWDSHGIAIPSDHRDDIPEHGADPVDMAVAIMDAIAFAYQMNDLLGSLSEDQRLDFFAGSLGNQGFQIS